MDTHSFTLLLLKFSSSKKKKKSSVGHPDYGHVVFGRSDLGLSKGQSSYFKMTHCSLLLQGESQQCHYSFVI